MTDVNDRRVWEIGQQVHLADLREPWTIDRLFVDQIRYVSLSRPTRETMCPDRPARSRMETVALAATSPAMIGRTSQLDGLRSALASAADGVPVTVVLGGEAGVGKTRLVTEFAAEAERGGARVVVGQCVNLGGEGLAYAPIAGALRELAGRLGPEALLSAAGPGRAALRSLLPDLPRDETEPAAVAGTSQGRVFEAVTGLLEQVAADRPLVLVLEDLHWADRSTRQLLGFAVRALGSARVLIVGTFRSDEVSRDHPLRTQLAELERIRTVHRIDVPRLTEERQRARVEHPDQARGVGPR